ncbi:chaperone modulator CbpM [Acidisphaera sp. L21]|uniref:chaperone modulator CbpM n=1 Tax=Acidisphaera sp. L21 TaxID=1641851 RepID=UPI001C20A248|nr:chaperone modulator CbpM [Acidisphaera sp. L21]
MITLEMLPRHVRGVRVEDVTRWVALAWVQPEQGPAGWLFREIDVARVRLLVELHDDMDLAEDALPIVLSLLDQLYDARRQMLALRGALEAVPAEAREAVLRALPP